MKSAFINTFFRIFFDRASIISLKIEISTDARRARSVCGVSANAKLKQTNKQTDSDSLIQSLKKD